MYPLPEGWSTPERVCDAVDVCGLTLHRAAVSSSGPGGREVTGAGADTDEAPSARADFELLERVATLDAIASGHADYPAFHRRSRAVHRRPGREVFPESVDPARWCFSRSNGVALHASWDEACDRAHGEAIERDRVLRSWCGWITPAAIPLVGARLRALESTAHAWAAHRFGAPSRAHDLEVVGVFGFPKSADVPIAIGYAARPTLGAAVDAAAREALQVLAFLWGEAIPSEAPAIGPSALHHLEHLLCPATHEGLRAWLAGAHARHGLRVAPPPVPGLPSFVDLTPAWLGDGLRVAKAVIDGAIPLTFGDAPFAAHLPPEVGPHPIA